jgi:hypothetical protein
MLGRTWAWAEQSTEPGGLAAVLASSLPLLSSLYYFVLPRQLARIKSWQTTVGAGRP